VCEPHDGQRRETRMQMFGGKRFERFFRAAAGLDVDKTDIKRFQDLLLHKLHDMILLAEATAEANDRDLICPQDLPITKGLQENMHAFRRMDEDIELAPILEQLAVYPPLTRDLSVDAERRLPIVVGGLGVAVARTFVTIDPQLTNPQTNDWERIGRVFDLLL
jgi:hypothetical protein